ncbi:MAG: hypothetical protein AMJ65_03715 [Phycisphaerae bacterium SG8_4]|nr:MAG: hypothetical protein AMJ65_03715 [Phycisphaerae bacterium SG8_4]
MACNSQVELRSSHGPNHQSRGQRDRPCPSPLGSGSRQIQICKFLIGRFEQPFNCLLKTGNAGYGLRACRFLQAFVDRLFKRIQEHSSRRCICGLKFIVVDLDYLAVAQTEGCGLDHCGRPSAQCRNGKWVKAGQIRKRAGTGTVCIDARPAAGDADSRQACKNQQKGRSRNSLEHLHGQHVFSFNPLG